MAPSDLSRIQASAIDGRMHTIYHRQEQLERLCKSLVDHVNEIKEAISADYGYSPAEVAVEYHLVLTAVKKYYGLLKPKEVHEEEYLIANGKDAADRRVPAGIIYIEPTLHTTFYSVVVPLAAAFAAGNCAIVLLENNHRTLSRLLRQLLTEALDADVFAVASSPIKDETLLSNAVCVLQNGVQNEQPRMNQLTHFEQAHVVAVVDRTADVQTAARELVAARFSFRGSSPYAPDVVLVNEFRKKDFLQAVIGECINLGSGVEMNGQIKGKTPSSNLVNERLSSLEKLDPELRTIIQEAKFAVVDVTSRDPLLQQRMTAPILAVHAVKSLDDAIDLIGSRSEKPSLAAYHFGSPAAGKYLSQFVNANISAINHIPRELLVGPAFPIGQPVDLTDRYPLDLFTVPRPAYINSLKTAEELSKALIGSNNPTAQKLLADATKPLVELKRHPGGSMGFFEVGFLMNAGIILASTLTVSATGLVWWWRYTRPI
ncbi:hypothetical protein M409DRAFT_19411 [Zasmidium cellare ATCC 36951]|uniref:Aldehyde dehydrogenase domain-containing protein n=1 Tax=Zasmidium cellare ATCC 36951 TaxID=1080233 RepID=A0A6A6CTW7_ZASCE|nr:uncharacterized protein M409DRAFT_19411 [Zasmidium cellare ATCC 36951]KAF2170594.1 hypothetical protein M409DRAFT_19411 [Zasmidium cellare ATCC 36951]